MFVYIRGCVRVRESLGCERPTRERLGNAEGGGGGGVVGVSAGAQT